jgi:protein-disulfide isomerase
MYIDRLKAKTKVEVTLEPPRVTVAIPADAPALGPITARVQIVEFADFQCPYCGQAAPLIKRMADQYGDRIRIAFRHFPLPMHSQAPDAAMAARCAQAQGKFWEYHDRLFANQKALAPADLKRYAGEIGLSSAGFDACLKDGATAKAVEVDFTDGQGYGVSATPTFYINGRLLSGAQPFEAFQKVIDEELARAR